MPLPPRTPWAAGGPRREGQSCVERTLAISRTEEVGMKITGEGGLEQSGVVLH